MVRATTEERAHWERCAASVGATSLGDWVRAAANAASGLLRRP